jgi:hypothetical protein
MRPVLAVDCATMAPDPNWFYSTLAQSTAAIVGLAGGFLVQRILAQRSDIAQDRRDLRDNAELLLNRMTTQKQSASQVARALEFAVAETERAQRSGQPLTLTVDQVFLLTHGQGYTAGSDNRLLPPLEADAALPMLQDALIAIGELRDAIPTTLDALAPMLVRSAKLEPGEASWLEQPVTEAPEQRGGIEPANFWEWVPRQRDVAREIWQSMNGPEGTTDVASARGLSTRLTILRERLVPGSFWALWWTLLGLLVASLIVPLTYLSAEGGPSMGRLTVVFGVLSLSFLGFIAYELRRIRRAGDLARETF